jgi:hypothetical protein
VRAGKSLPDNKGHEEKGVLLTFIISTQLFIMVFCFCDGPGLDL